MILDRIFLEVRVALLENRPCDFCLIQRDPRGNCVGRQATLTSLPGKLAVNECVALEFECLHIAEL